jgi:hypothetical protein
VYVGTPLTIVIAGTRATKKSTLHMDCFGSLAMTA